MIEQNEKKQKGLPVVLLFSLFLSTLQRFIFPLPRPLLVLFAILLFFPCSSFFFFPLLAGQWPEGQPKNPIPFSSLLVAQQEGEEEEEEKSCFKLKPHNRTFKQKEKKELPCLEGCCVTPPLFLCSALFVLPYHRWFVWLHPPPLFFQNITSCLPKYQNRRSKKQRKKAGRCFFPFLCGCCFAYQAHNEGKAQPGGTRA
jgi:hypothetical protein